MGKYPTDKYIVIFIIFAISLAAFGFVYGRGQDTNYDLLNYHYYTGYAALHQRYQDMAACGYHSFFNPMTYVVVYLSLKYLTFPFSSWVFLVIQLLSVPALALIAREVGKGLGYPRITVFEAVALLLCFISPIWWSELGTTLSTSWTAALVLWGLHMLMRSFSGEKFSSFFIVASGILLGLATGLKLTNAVFALAMSISLLYLTYSLGWKALLRKCSCFFGGGILGISTTAWWNLYLWKQWSSPVFPLYNKIFRSPYYDLFNVRDLRWQFTSISDFLVFLGQTAFGTLKTAELEFVDVRYLIIVLLIPAAILCKPVTVYRKQIGAFLIFVVSAVLLWAVALAHQRYIMPVELLLGLVIWILLARVAERRYIRITVIVVFYILAAFLVKTPDWSHAKVEFNEKDPFKIQIPNWVKDTPGRYLIVGRTVSYLLPFLDPASEFYGLAASNQIDALIYQKISNPSKLPLRILGREEDSPSFRDILGKINSDNPGHQLHCAFIKSRIERYSICEVVPSNKGPQPGDLIVNINFSETEYFQQKDVLWDKGLATPEPWGSWSNGDIVEVGMANCLPPGRLKIMVTGRAFGPNVNQPINFKIDNIENRLTYKESDSVGTLQFSNQTPCADKISFHIPEPKSPEELGLGNDNRKLGIGLCSIQIYKE